MSDMRRSTTYKRVCELQKVRIYPKSQVRNLGEWCCNLKIKLYTQNSIFLRFCQWWRTEPLLTYIQIKRILVQPIWLASILSLIYSVEKNCKELILFYLNAAGLGLLTWMTLEASRFLIRRSLASPMYSGFIM